MTGTITTLPKWELPPTEPDIIKNFSTYLQGLQTLKETAVILEDQMQDSISLKKIEKEIPSFINSLTQISTHLAELAHRMYDDNFFPISPELDPPFEEAKTRSLSYITEHPDSPIWDIIWFLRCTDELAERVLAALIQEQKIQQKDVRYYARPDQ